MTQTNGTTTPLSWYCFQGPVQDFIRTSPLRAQWRLGPAVVVDGYLVSGHSIINLSLCKQSALRKIVTENYDRVFDALQWCVLQFVNGDFVAVTSITVTDCGGALTPSQSAVIARTAFGESYAYPGPMVKLGAELAPQGVLHIVKAKSMPDLPMLAFVVQESLACAFTPYCTDRQTIKSCCSQS